MRHYLHQLRPVLIALTLLVGSGAAASAADGDGGYAGSYFQIPVGARPAAMGGAYLAVSDDGAGPLYNPAGIALMKQRLFATSYRVLQLDRKLGYLTYVMPARGDAIVGFNWHYFGSGSVERRDSDGRPLGGELSYNSHAVSVLFAKKFEDYLALGMRAAYLHSTFAEMTSFSIGIDIGAMIYLSNLADRDRRDQKAVQDIRIGAVIKNLAAQYRWNSSGYNAAYNIQSAFGVEQTDKVPIEFGLGGSARFLQRKLLLASDIYKNIEQGPRFHAGAEYQLAPEFSLRSGYSDKRFTVGTGYLFKFDKKVLAIDYAFATGRVSEGSEHIFSFDLLF